MRSPPGVVRRVGMSYFAYRFGLGDPSVSTDDDGWLQDLPIRHPLADVTFASDATLDVGRFHVPLFQKVTEVEGKERWTARSDGRRMTGAAIKNGTVVLGFDPWAAMGAGLLGFATAPESAYGSQVRREKVPWVDQFASHLANAVGLAGYNLSLRRRWPNNAPFAVCLTHDVDRTRKTFQYVTHLGGKRALRGVRMKSRPRTKSYWGFDTIKDIEGGANVRSTFFLLHEGPEAKRGLRNRVLAWGLADFEDPEVAAVARSLSQGGWEIGLHASLASTESVDRLASERRKLESVLGAPVTGVRQHHLRLRLPERWDEFSKEGFVYDASLGFRDTWGFRAGTAFPYRLAGSSGLLGLEEISLQIMDSTLASCDDPWGECIRAMDMVQSVGGVLTVLFHQRFFDSRNFPGFVDLYERLLQEARARGAWIARAGDIVEAWSM
jgi:hypothetical protein